MHMTPGVKTRQHRSRATSLLSDEENKKDSNFSKRGSRGYMTETKPSRDAAAAAAAAQYSNSMNLSRSMPAA